MHLRITRQEIEILKLYFSYAGKREVSMNHITERACPCCGQDVMDCDCQFCDLCGTCQTHGSCDCYTDESASATGLSLCDEYCTTCSHNVCTQHGICFDCADSKTAVAMLDQTVGSSDFDRPCGCSEIMYV